MLEPGQLIDGKYRVQRLLGKGGMGAVFEGYHTLIERRVAIKVLHPEVTSSQDGVARFMREVRAAGRIGNEHILEIFDVGMLPDGSRYMVSEYLDGETLSTRISRAPLSPRAVAELTLQLLTGLAAAHQSGIVHRDLKPDNIFLLREKSGHSDFVKIIDFGISKFQFDDDNAMGMTATGAVLGTPYYLSPEQARGQRDIDARSDIYAVGVIMYQAVAGRVPVQANSFNELLFKIALESPPPLSEILPGVDAQFSAITQRAMARERDARFQNASEMHQALTGWLAFTSSSRYSPGTLPSVSINRLSGVPAPSLPTSSSFGRTAPHTTERSRSRATYWVAGGLAVLATAGVAGSLALRRGSDGLAVSSTTPPAATVTPNVSSRASAAQEVPASGPASVATASAAAPEVVPAPSPGGTAAAAEQRPPHEVRARVGARPSTARPASASASPTPTATQQAPAAAVTAAPPPPPPPPPTQASPPAATHTRPARDFGY